MLFEFIVLNREEIVARTRTKVRGRPWPSVSDQEIEHGVPLFLTQLADTLRLETTAEPFSSDAVGATATRHGAELLAAGFNVAQVVHDYGDICQAITEIAIEQHAPITVEEFHTLNRCLDTAIAEAVTEHTRLASLKRSEEEVEARAQWGGWASAFLECTRDHHRRAAPFRVDKKGRGVFRRTLTRATHRSTHSTNAGGISLRTIVTRRIRSSRNSVAMPSRAAATVEYRAHTSAIAVADPRVIVGISLNMA